MLTVDDGLLRKKLVAITTGIKSKSYKGNIYYKAFATLINKRTKQINLYTPITTSHF